MSDKPLVERLRDSTAHTYSSENADLYRGFDNGRESAAQMVEAFVREHLTEQTEPSTALQAWTLGVISASGFDGAPTTEEAAEILARNIFDLIEQERCRIRELLVGKETK